MWMVGYLLNELTFNIENVTISEKCSEQITTTNPPTQSTAVNFTEPLVEDDSCQTLFASCNQEKTGRNCANLNKIFEKECFNTLHHADSCSLGCKQAFTALVKHPNFKNDRLDFLVLFTVGQF